MTAVPHTDDELREHVVTDLLSRGWDELLAQKWYDDVLAKGIQADRTARYQALLEALPDEKVGTEKMPLNHSELGYNVAIQDVRTIIKDKLGESE